MTSPLTENRKKKMSIIKECIDDLMELSWMDTIERDNVKMADFKALILKVKEMRKSAEMRKRAKENYTGNSEIMPLITIAPQRDAQGTELHGE
jgi:hypothetical protein